MLCSFRFFFVWFSLHLIFVLLQIFMFRNDAKPAKKTLFSQRSENERRTLVTVNLNDKFAWNKCW